MPLIILIYVHTTTLPHPRILTPATNTTQPKKKTGAAYAECDSTQGALEILDQSLQDASPQTPIYFILSPGANVVGTLFCKACVYIYLYTCVYVCVCILTYRPPPIYMYIHVSPYPPIIFHAGILDKLADKYGFVKGASYHNVSMGQGQVLIYIPINI